MAAPLAAAGGAAAPVLQVPAAAPLTIAQIMQGGNFLLKLNERAQAEVVKLGADLAAERLKSKKSDFSIPSIKNGWECAALVVKIGFVATKCLLGLGVAIIGGGYGIITAGSLAWELANEYEAPTIPTHDTSNLTHVDAFRVKGRYAKQMLDKVIENNGEIVGFFAGMGKDVVVSTYKGASEQGIQGLAEMAEVTAGQAVNSTLDESAKLAKETTAKFSQFLVRLEDLWVKNLYNTPQPFPVCHEVEEPSTNPGSTRNDNSQSAPTITIKNVPTQSPPTKPTVQIPTVTSSQSPPTPAPAPTPAQKPKAEGGYEKLTRKFSEWKQAAETKEWRKDAYAFMEKQQEVASKWANDTLPDAKTAGIGGAVVVSAAGLYAAKRNKDTLKKVTRAATKRISENAKILKSKSLIVFNKAVDEVTTRK